MALINWSDSLNVNVQQIDREHKVLVDYINELNDAMKSGHGKEILKPIIINLYNYSKTHFATEEAIFDKTNYPDAEEHIRQHQLFIKKIYDFKQSFIDGKVGLSIDILNFLKDWLTKHIMSTDKKYVPHFNANGLN